MRTSRGLSSVVCLKMAMMIPLACVPVTCRFEILSLTGSFMPSDNGVTKSRSGGMSVSLAGPDGRVLGGGLAGMLVAAGPVQEQKPKKPKYEQTISFAPAPANPISEERYEAAYNGPKPNLTTSVNTMHGSKISDPENNVLLPGEDSRERNHEITC
ncbi:UNVERIFIED_CONTAM: AT-hook motif nuclear-localized protein 1 [Sesamum latifolium]|uniref:AT-hook motif nuclear-localized protein n=1 Tax=Sesamum latifolium TaxID=2727402 RepID=A0AAW2T8F9_9LAMI